MTTTPSTPSGYWAARLALLSLRAGLPKRARVGLDAFVLASSPSLTADAAARKLLTLDRPLYCAANARDGVVQVEYGPLDKSPLPSSHVRQANFLSYMVGKRFGEPTSHLRVIFVGREERLNISLADVAQFYRDYDCFPSGGAAADWVDSPFAKSHHITPQTADGAVAVCQIFPVDVARFGCALPLPRWLARLIWARQRSHILPPGQRDA